MKSVSLIIPAGGKGERLGYSIPKQFLKVQEKMILEHTLLAFRSFPLKQCIVAVPEKELVRVERLNPLDFPCKVEIITGGQTRAESVKNAIDNLNKTDYVLIHDAARPCVSETLIQNILNALTAHAAVIPVISISDTIKKVKDHTVIETISRDTLKRVQTPQGFHYQTIKSAYQSEYWQQVTDESSLVETQGDRIHCVEGDPENIKITIEKDLKYFTFLLKTELEKN